MKDHEIREAINKLRDIAIKWHKYEQLRDRIAHVVLDMVKDLRSETEFDMKLVLNHTRKQEIFDLDETGSVIFNVEDTKWLKVYKIGNEIRVCFEFESPEHPKELLDEKVR